MKKNELSEKLLDISSLIEIPLEYIENIADPLLDSFVSAVPIVGLLKGIAKAGNAIRENHLLRKTLLFMKQLESSLNDEDIESFDKYREKVNSSDKSTIDELNRILFILEKTVETEKAIYISNAFYYYINQKIDRNTFLEMITILDILMVRDLEVVSLLIKGKKEFDNESQQISTNRLEAAGVVYQTTIDGNGTDLHCYELSKLGKGMAWFMLKEHTASKVKFSL